MKPTFSIKLVTALTLASLVCGAASAAAGAADSPQTTVVTGWSDMSSGGSHRLALKMDGTVWAWGGNGAGQLGIGQFSGPEKLPVQIKQLHNVAALGTGNANSYAILKDGTVWSWGDNTDGQLGNGQVTERQIGPGNVIVQHNEALPVQLKELSHIVSITGDFAATYAVQDDGSLWGWGFISIPYTTRPFKLSAWTNIRMVATSYSGSVVALRKDGTVLVPGKDGQPVQVQGLEHVKSVAIADTCLALKDDGTIWEWGFEEHSKPTKDPSIGDVAEIQATMFSPIYLKKDGTVWAKGRNTGGQLGIGSYEDSSVPVQVKGLTHIRHITASPTGNNVMALREDHTLWGWGDGYTGDGTGWWRTVPVLIKSDETQPTETYDTIKVDVNGQALSFEQFPILQQDTTMVPMRKIFETLGAQVSWDGDSSTVTAVKDGATLRIAIGAAAAEINGQSAELDAPAVLLNGTTLVPVRFVAESFGATVTWDDTTKTVRIQTAAESSVNHE